MILLVCIYDISEFTQWRHPHWGYGALAPVIFEIPFSKIPNLAVLAPEKVCLAPVKQMCV